MENNEKVKFGIVAIISMIVGVFGGEVIDITDDADNVMYLSQYEKENGKLCPTTEDNVHVFERMSASEMTGYYTDATGEEITVRCREGRKGVVFMDVAEWADANGVTIITSGFVTPIEPASHSGANKIFCNQGGCVSVS